MAIAFLLISCHVPAHPDIEKLMGNRGTAPCNVVGRVLTVAELLRVISKETGKELATEPAIANEPLIIHGAKLSVNRLLQCVATACDAEWETEEDSARLRRTAEVSNRLQKQELEARQKQLDSAFVSVEKRIAQQRSPAEWSRQMLDDFIANVNGSGIPKNGELDLATPARGLRDRLVMRLDKSALARLAVGDRAYFCNAPTDLQFRFPYEVASVLAQYVEAETATLGLFGAVYPFQAKSVYEQKEYERQWDKLRLAANEARNVAKVILRWSVGRDLVLPYLFVYDTDGRQIAGSGDYYSLASRSQPPLFELTERIGDVVLSLSGDAEFHAQLPRSYAEFASRRGVLPSSGMRAKLAEILKNDPLSFEVTEVFQTISRETGLPLIARVPDDLFLKWRQVSTNSKVKLRSFLEFARSIGVSIAVNDGVVVAKPAYPLDAELWRLPRPELAESLEQAKRTNSFGFLQWCRLHFHCDGRMTTEAKYYWAGVVESLLNSGDDEVPSSAVSATVLRAIGGLPQQATVNLLAGRTLSIRDIPEAARNQFFRWASARPALRATTALGVSDLELQATEAFSNGEFTNANLSFEKSELDCVVLSRPSESPGYFAEPSRVPQSVKDLGEMAGYLVATGRSTSIEDALSGYWRTGKLELWTLKLSYKGRVFWQEEIAGSSKFNSPQDGVRYGELPESFRNAIRKFAREKIGGG